MRLMPEFLVKMVIIGSIACLFSACTEPPIRPVIPGMDSITNGSGIGNYTGQPLTTNFSYSWNDSNGSGEVSGSSFSYNWSTPTSSGYVKKSSYSYASRNTYHNSNSIKEFWITASNNTFYPSEIKVDKDDIVRLHIKSTDFKIGFGIPEYGINKLVPKSEEILIEFIADQPGSFDFICTENCEKYGRDMIGQLIVD